MAMKFGRKKSRGPGDPPIKVGTKLPAMGVGYVYAVKKVSEDKRDPKDKMWNNPKNWEWSRTPPKPKAKPKPKPQAKPKAKPKAKKPIKYYKNGKVIGISKYIQGS